MPNSSSAEADLYVDTAGSGTPVLLLHGFTLDHRQWEPQLAALTQEYRVSRLDLRGHGRSARPPLGYTFAAAASDARRAMDEIGMDERQPGFIVAHSLSGDAALQAALAEPQALRGVVVVTPAVWGHRWSDDWIALWRAMRAEARAGRLQFALARFRSDTLFDGLRGHPEHEAALDAMHSGFAGAQLLSDEKEAGTPTLDRLHECKVPVLVQSAERDRADFRAAAREILARVPTAQHMEWPATGHFPNLEHPRAFGQTLLEFMHEHA